MCDLEKVFAKTFEALCRRILTVPKHIHKSEKVKYRHAKDRRSFIENNNKDSLKQFIGKFEAVENYCNKAKSLSINFNFFSFFS